MLIAESRLSGMAPVFPGWLSSAVILVLAGRVRLHRGFEVPLPHICHDKNLAFRNFRHYNNSWKSSATRRRTRPKHGVSPTDAALMDMGDATISPDTRFDHGESRFRAWGFIHGVLHVMAFTRRGEKVRPISLRKANANEARRHAKDQA